MRIANVVLSLLVVVGGAVQLMQHLDDWARTLGGLFGIGLWGAPFFLAWRGLSSASTLAAVRTAQRINVLYIGLAILVVAAIGVALVNRDFRFDGFLAVTLVCVVFGIPLVLNLRALGKRKGELNRNNTIQTAAIVAPDIAPSATAPGSTISVAMPESRRDLSSNYFFRHWRGDLPLGITYWVNGTLIGGMLPAILIAVLTKWAATSGSLRLVALAWILSFVVLLSLWLWGAVGIWRSAHGHVARGGKAVWAGLAKFAVVLGVIGMGGQLATSLLPMLKEMTLIASGNDPVGGYKATVSSDGKSVLIRGMLRTDSAQEIERLLDSTPAVKTVVLSSNGGRLLEGQILATAVSKRGLNTYVEDICLSTCTIVFLAGKDRASTPNARIGFHTPSFPGANPDTVRAGTQFMMDLYRRAGLPAFFLQKVISVPATSMWYPTRDELIDANVITRVSLGGETATTFARLSSKQELVLMLRGLPLWQAIEKRFPNSLALAVDQGWQVRERGGTDNQIQTAMRAVVADLYPILLREASTESMEKFARLFIDQMRVARAVSYEACQKYVNGTLSPQAVLPNELIEREQRWMLEALIAEPMLSREYSNAAVENALVAATSKMNSAQLAVVANPEKYRNRPDLVCDSLLAMYETVLSLPPNQRRAALEGMFKEGV